jgi:hypothetical protein
MQSINKFLGGFGSVGTAVANVLVFLTTNWTIVVSAALAIFAALVGWAYDIASNPHVQVGVGAFVATLWTCIGLVVLADRRKPRTIRAFQDYQYALTFEGLAPFYEPKNEEALQFGIQFRNFSNGPLRFHIEKFQVLIGDRIFPIGKPPPATNFMPRGGVERIKLRDSKEIH